MTIKIHHNTAKRAARFGVTLTVSENEVEASKDGCVLASAPQANVALDKAIAVIERSHNEDEEGYEPEGDDDFEGEGQDDAEGDVDEEAGEDEEEGEDEDSGHSIVKLKYKKIYRPFKQTCGDDLARRISTAIKVAVTVVTKSGKTKKVMRIDPKRLQRLARMNGVWSDEYLKLNIGQARMNVGNRLRKLAKDGVEIKGL